MVRNHKLQLLGALAVIALAAAAISLGLQTYFGRQLPMMLLGPALAATASAALAVWLGMPRS